MELSHDGHRQRLREKIMKNPEALPPHEIIEFLLYHAIPRRDLNPIAHALLEHFGSLRGVFCAPPAELQQVKGISPAVAEYLYLLGQAMAEYAATDEVCIFLHTRADARNFLMRFFRERNMTGSWVLCLDSSGLLTHFAPLDESPVWHDAPNLFRLFRYALDSQAHYILIARETPDCTFSAEELHIMTRLIDAMKECRVQLLEHIAFSTATGAVNYATNPILYQQIAEPVASLASRWLNI